MNKQQIHEIKNIIVKAGNIATRIRNFNLNVTYKKDNSPVTNADKEISDYIFHALSELAPGIPIICEERPITDVANQNRFWLIDPIDGTRSFIKNHDTYTVNIALIENREAKYGFIYLPDKDRLYYTDADRNLIIEENGKIVEGNKHNLDGCVAVISSHHLNSKTQSYINDHNFAKVIAVPSSIKLCMIAEGAADIYPKFGETMEWDIAAGHALIKASGGEIQTLEGSAVKYAKENFLNSHFIALNFKMSS
jgi:3'(2'), 5'-bisphosphate nucleotidase